MQGAFAAHCVHNPNDGVSKLTNVNAFLMRTLRDETSPIVRAGVKRLNQVTLLFALHREHTRDWLAQLQDAALAFGFGIAVTTKTQLRWMLGPTLLTVLDFESRSNRNE